MSLRLVIYLSFSVLFMALATGPVFAESVQGKEEQAPEEISAYEHLDQFIDVLTIIRKNYVEQAPIDQLMSGAIKGMLNELDPHSAYMPPDMFDEMQIETMGEFNGLGVEITVKDHLITIIAPIADTPADRAGIRAGDIIIEIDGVLTKEMSVMDAVNKMRGPKGSKISLGIMRSGESAPLTFTLTRETIRVDSIKHRLYDPAIGYVRISQFQQRTAREFKAALKQLHEEAELQGLVIDLRNNPGGLLDQAVQVCDLFLDSGKIVSTQGRRSTDNFTYNATALDTEPSYPIVVLINEGSASASEIVAGALQDHKRAVILGTGSFGKGSVQSIIPLANHSGLRLTTAYYYTPNGTSIQARGIVPDVHVEQAVWQQTVTTQQTKEKDLDNHLETPTQESLGNATPQPDEEPPSDFQLLRALDLLRGWQQMKHLQPCLTNDEAATS
nr:S41 family peptidase [uncultured Desulfuromonas sp.]